jgi:hypothetical protein
MSTYNHPSDNSKRDLDRRIQSLKDKIEINEAIVSALKRQLEHAFIERSKYIK